MMRIGQSTDIHQLNPGEFIIIGGIKVPSLYCSVGHSDADCLLHAIAESLLGALALGDLGSWFPDNDDQYKGIDSSILLEKVVDEIHKRGYVVNNIDTMVFLQEPKLRPYIDSMRENISRLLRIQKELVSVKATTGENIGIVGRKEAIVASSTVLLVSKQ